MTIYKGAAFTSFTSVGSTRFWAASDVAASVSPSAPADSTGAFEQNATAANLTFTVSQATSGLAPPAAATTIDVTLYDSDSGTVIDTAQLTGTPTLPATVTLNCSSDGTSSGTPLIGDMRIYVRARKTDGAGGVGNYDVNSDTDVKKGVWRCNPTTSTLVESTANGAGGGSIASGTTRAWPDSQTYTLTLSHAFKTSSRDTILFQTRKSDLSAVYNSVSIAAAAASSFNDGGNKIDTDFPLALTAVVGQCTVPFSRIAPTSDSSFRAWKFPSGSGQFVDAANLRTASENVDPRITVVSPTRTTSDAVVNFSTAGAVFQSVGGTFLLDNARSEHSNAWNVAGDKLVDVKSRDVTAALDESQIGTALVPSNSTGVYTVPSFTYSGPTSTASRGTGPNGDTAAHTTSGAAKTLHCSLTAAKAPNAIAAGTFVSLSDLLKVDVHPQRGGTLVKDTDPYASPGDGEDTVYAIAVDSLAVFAFVGDVNATSANLASDGRGNVDVTFSYFDPGDIHANQTDIVRTSATGANLGWTTLPSTFDVKAPAGVWKVRAQVDVDAVGSGGNYAVGATLPTNVAAIDQDITFNSPYSADRDIAIHMPDEVYPGQVVRIVVEYKQKDLGRVLFDAAPTLAVYYVDKTTGAASTEMAATTMTQFSGQVAWYVDWTVSGAAAGDLEVEVRALYLGLKIDESERISVRPKFDPVGLAVDGVLVARM